MSDIQQTRKSEPSKYAHKEIFEITPVKFGGSPTDPLNKTILNRSEHIQAVNYWNKILKTLSSQKR